MSSYLTGEQIAQLLKAINPLRVGKNAKGHSHVEAYEIRAHLNRLFGFARWSADVLDQRLVFEEEVTLLRKDKQTRQPIPGSEYQAWSVCYRTILRLTVCAPDGTVLATYTEGATGDAQNQPSRADAHDNALKTSESQALKRAAHNLGDQFGLSTWGKGSMAALVKRTLVGAEAPAEGDVTEHITAPLAPESEETPETPAPQGEDAATAPSPATPAGQDTTHWAGIIRDRVIKEAPTKTGAARKTFLLKQLQEAAAKGVANATVADGNGGAMSLEKLITDAMRVA